MGNRLAKSGLDVNKRVAFSIFSVLLTIVLCWIAGEIFTFLYYGLSRVNRPIFVPDAFLGYVHRRDASFMYMYEEEKQVRIAQKTDTWGFMGEGPVILDKPPDVFRIIILGDSHTEALQVPYDQSYPVQLQEFLNAGRSLRYKKYEIINAGMSGYSPISMYLYYKIKLRAFKSDIVIMQLFANDVYEDHKARAMSVMDDNGLPVKIIPYFRKNKPSVDEAYREQGSLFNRVREWMIAHSRFMEYLHSVYFRRMKKAEYHKTMTAIPEYDIGHQFFILYNNGGTLEDENFRRRVCTQTDQYILGLKAMVEEDKAQFAMVYIPMESQLKREKYSDHVRIYTATQQGNYWNRWLNRLSERENISWLDLTPIFQEHEADGIYLNKDGHLTSYGHMLMAQELHKFLVNRIEPLSFTQLNGGRSER